MTPATLYEITSRPVALADSFIVSRNNTPGQRRSCPLMARLWWALAGDCGPWEWLAARVKGVRLRGA